MKNDRFADIPNSELIHCIDEWVRSSRNRDILKSRYIDGIRIEKIAEDHDLSIRQINYIIRSQSDLIARKLHI